MRAGHVDVGSDRTDDLHGTQLVGRVLERPEEGYCDSLHLVRFDEASYRGFHRGFVERDHFLAHAVHALGDLLDESTGHQRQRLVRGLRVERILQLEPGDAAGTPHDEDGIPMPGCSQQTRTRSPAFNERVGPHGCTETEALSGGDELRHCGVALVGEDRQRLEHAHSKVVLGRGSLGVVKPAMLIHGSAVSEGAPSVDADVVDHRPPPRTRSPWAG